MRLAPSGVSRNVALLLVASLLLGILYRNVWIEDMEWKGDQWTLFQGTQSSPLLPWVGMQSSVGLPNPGMSQWVFTALSRLGGLYEPLALERSVMLMNSLAITLLLLFALHVAEDQERPAWLWAAALAPVNPGAVQLQRVIWAQSVLPLFSLATLFGWWHRHTRWGAFLWGAVGACLGQIHMSGFFFAGALALWTARFDRLSQPPRWRWWLLGTASAAWPLIPWAAALLHEPRHGPLRYHLGLQFYSRWAGDVTGMETERSLGRQNFFSWLGEPLWSGHRSFIVGLLMLFSMALVAVAIIGACRRLWPRRQEWRQLVAGSSPTGWAQNAAFVGFGALITLAGLRVYPHYLIVAFPLTYLWLSRAALQLPQGKRMLGGIWVAHALLTVAFLVHIHQNGGSPGDYGATHLHQLTGH